MPIAKDIWTKIQSKIMEKKMKMYLSFPITGRKLKDVKVYAKRVKMKWESLGYDVITPFEVCEEENKSYAYYMGKDVEALLECDGIIMCDDWFTSKGCRLEYNVAEIYGKKIRLDNVKYIGGYEHGQDNQV